MTPKDVTPNTKLTLTLGLAATTLAAVIGFAFAFGVWKTGQEKDIEAIRAEVLGVKGELGRVGHKLDALSEDRCRCGDLYKRWPPDAQK